MKKVQEFLAPIRAHLLRTAKAWVAAGVTALVAWLAQIGLQVPNEVETTALVFLYAVVSWLLTWLIPNRVQE